MRTLDLEGRRLMWPEDPELRREALALYGAVWEHVPPGILQAGRWGGDWFEMSTPFLVHCDGRLVAHVGMIECRFHLARGALRTAAIHGVCVHPEHRGQGYCRQAMEQALEHVDRLGFEATVLWSEKVDLYRRFDFRPLAESVFEISLSKGEIEASAETEAYRLSLEDDAHLELLRERLRAREPVSEIAAAGDDGGHFLIDLGLWTQVETPLLVAVPECKAILVGDVEDQTLHLYDVIAQSLPSAEQIVAAVRQVVGESVERLTTYFSPEKLEVAGAWTIREHPFEDLLMVRGEALVEDGRPFALSPFTRT